MSRTFNKKYLIPLALIIFLLMAFAWLANQYANSGNSLMFFALCADFVLIIVLMVLIVRKVFMDHTSHQQSQERLAEANERYRALMETSTDGTLIIIEKGIVHANFVFLAMSGYTLTDLSQLKFENLIAIKSLPGLNLETFYEEIGDTGRTVNMEATISCKRGEMREVILTASRVELMGQHGIIIVSKDLSRKERIEKESINLMNELQSSILMMNLPVSSFVREHITCDMDMPVHEVASIMRRKDQNAIIVTKDTSQQPVGIVTDCDLRNRVVAIEFNVNSPVFEIMSSPLIRIPDEALLYEAVLQIKGNSISHLAVEDRAGRIVGIFSNEDLLEVQRNSISYLIKEVSAAETVESLKKIHNKIPVLVKILLESGSRVRNITYLISTVTDAITHRLVEFAIEEMGEPPAEFAFLALGSEGRREQTLVTDQDNAIVFEDVPNEKFAEVNRYFLYFGKKINLWLDKIGYQYCQGEVMAGNPQWCQPISRWKKYFSDWINQKSQDGLLGVAVFFDFRIVYGSEKYADELRKHINKIIDGKTLFFRLLASDVSKYNIPTDIFKENGPENGPGAPEAFNIKNAISPLVDFIRVYSIQHHVGESNSLLRLEKMLRMNIIPEEEYHEIENIYSRMMEIRFRSHVNAILDNKSPDNMVSREELTVIEQTMIRKTFSEIIRYQQKILDDFSV
ncbi:MAG: CBS domain-containing protein [Bacteroidales bacterium]|nr:CBS domain-containing protein [Bacteroidales bacterium]